MQEAGLGEAATQVGRAVPLPPRRRTCSAVRPSEPSIEIREVKAREKREPLEPLALPNDCAARRGEGSGQCNVLT